MKRFRVLLVYPNLQLITLLPNNVAVLAAFLKDAGIEVRVFNTTFYRTAEKSIEELRVEYMQIRPFNLEDKGIKYKPTDIYDDFVKLVEEYEPDLIGVTATEDTYALGISLVSRIKNKDIHVIFGGVHPTFSAEEVIANPRVDSLCIGEGEGPLLELCIKLQQKKDVTTIKNIWIKNNGKIYRNEIRPPLDINALPYEDFSVFEEEMFFRPMQGKIYRMIPVVISRGCPFNCSFCAAPLLRELYLGSEHKKYFRTKTMERIISELKYYVHRHKADYVYFNSETFFAVNEREFAEFAEKYIKEINLPFWCQTRIETVSKDKIDILKNMNCHRINIGLEHGNESFRKRILKKNFSNRQAKDSFGVIEKSGIPFTINNMIGFPDETRELVFDTIRLNRTIKADAINAFTFVPYRGTPLRQYCIEKGYLSPDAVSNTNIGDSILDMPQLSREEIKGLVRTFPLYVKMPESYFDDIRIAEQMNKEGDTMLVKLREIYFNNYFK